MSREYANIICMREKLYGAETIGHSASFLSPSQSLPYRIPSLAGVVEQSEGCLRQNGTEGRETGRVSDEPSNDAHVISVAAMTHSQKGVWATRNYQIYDVPTSGSLRARYFQGTRSRTHTHAEKTRMYGRMIAPWALDSPYGRDGQLLDDARARFTSSTCGGNHRTSTDICREICCI